MHFVVFQQVASRSPFLLRSFLPPRPPHLRVRDCLNRRKQRVMTKGVSRRARRERRAAHGGKTHTKPSGLMPVEYKQKTFLNYERRECTRKRRIMKTSHPNEPQGNSTLPAFSLSNRVNRCNLWKNNRAPSRPLRPFVPSCFKQKHAKHAKMNFHPVHPVHPVSICVFSARFSQNRWRDLGETMTLLSAIP